MSLKEIWKLRERAAFEREIKLAWAAAPHPWDAKQRLLAEFHRHLLMHPLEWPASARPPSEHSMRLVGILLIRYRLIPDAQAVEILSVSPIEKPPQASDTAD